MQNTSSLLLRSDLVSLNVVPVRVPSRCQIDLFKNYSYSIGSCAKKKKDLLRKNCTKYVNMNVIPTPLCINSPRRVDISSGECGVLPGQL